MFNYVVQITGDIRQLHPAVGAVAAGMRIGLGATGQEPARFFVGTVIIDVRSYERPLGPREMLDEQKRIAAELPGNGNWIIDLREVGTRRRHTAVVRNREPS